MLALYFWLRAYLDSQDRLIRRVERLAAFRRAQRDLRKQARK